MISMFIEYGDFKELAIYYLYPPLQEHETKSVST